MADSCELSVIVPLYNEAGNVVPLWRELHDVLDAWGGDYELIFVDDGSTDDTVARLRAAAGDDARLVVARLERNSGQTAAMAAGFDLARGRVWVPLDGDRQNDPAEIPRMIARLALDADLVCGWRRRRQDDALRSFVSRVANRLIGRVTGVRLHDYGCTLKAFKAEFIRGERLYGEMHRFLPVVARMRGARIVEMEVNHRARVAGQTKYGLGRTFRVVLDLVLVQFLTKYRGRALRFFGPWIWALAIGGGVSVLASLVSRAGWGWFTIGVVLSVGALLALMVALCAELLWRVYYESRDARPYRVAEVIRGGAK
ncbi:MAG: glycosyltransferase family 2 protein [Phycisphaerae bacterium]